MRPTHVHARNPHVRTACARVGCEGWEGAICGREGDDGEEGGQGRRDDGCAVEGGADERRRRALCHRCDAVERGAGERCAVERGDGEHDADWAVAAPG